MFKNALVSVSEKKGLNAFLKKVSGTSSQIVSTGGTAKSLIEDGFNVKPVEEWTGHPEVMGGRVKTLHPRVHMSLLYRDQDMSLLKEHQLEAFDLVIGNLYKFAENPSIETIDIGGPSFLRSAAKNFEKIIILCDPEDYDWVAEKKLQLSLDERRYLAAKVFRHTSVYDANISSWLESQTEKQAYSQWSWGGNIQEQLRYGENPSQKAFWVAPAAKSASLLEARLLQGKALSYNNILDLSAAIQCMNLFKSEAVAVAVKHNNPCGVAIDKTIEKVMTKCLAADPKSVFGGIIAMNQEISADVATQLNELFLECVVAPKVSKAAQDIFAKKQNLRVLEWPEVTNFKAQNQFRSVLGGCLVQSTDSVVSTWQDSWEVCGEAPSEPTKNEMLFAWKVCAALKSNAIALTKNLQSVGLGMGQVNRVDAVDQAIQRANLFHSIDKQTVLASDAFFPFEDSIEKIHEAGVRWVIQPGGSVRDEKVKAKAKELGVNMVLTGQRHFNH